MPDREPPPKEVTHNWPAYKKDRKVRKDVARPWPVTLVELEVLGFEPHPFPECHAQNTPKGSEFAQDEERYDAFLCHRPAGDGTAHLGYGPCVKHAGNTRAVRKGAAVEAGMHFIRQFKAEVLMFGGDPATIRVTPQEALLEEVRRSVAMVRYLQSQISTWNPAAGDLGTLPALTDETTRGQGTPTDAAEWLRLYRDERAHMVRVSKMTLDAGVDLALLRLEQEKGLLLAQAVREILDSLQLSPEQAILVPKVVPEILAKFSVTPVDSSSGVESAPVLEGVILD